MPDWLMALGGGLLGLAAVVSAFGVIRNKIVRPLINGYGELLKLLSQIRDASSGVQRLAREVEGLAGAITNFVVGIRDEVDDHTQRLGRLEEMRSMVVDLQADFERHVRDPGGHG